MKNNEDNKKDGKVISFINMKGGVGKTTLSIGIASYMSKIKNKKVLVIDVDPQFNATQSLLDDNKNKKETDDYYNKNILGIKNENGLSENKTILKLFSTSTMIDQKMKIPNPKELIVKLTDNLDLLCGDLSLVLINKIMDPSLPKRIKKFIENNNLKSFYDYIIIDCPPTMTTYTESALFASDFYIIPNKIDRYSIIGIDSLQRSVENLFEDSENKLTCLGIVYTVIENNLPSKKIDIKNDFETKKVVNDLDIFDSELKEAKNIQIGKKGTNPMSYSSSKDDIQAISEEMVKRIKENIDSK